MSPKDFAAQWQGFQTNSSQRKVLICVIKSGASFNAYAAAYEFFLGYEWDFNLNMQAEDRACRIGQHNFVNVYYMINRNTVDEDVAQRLNDKQDANNWVIGTEEQYRMLLNRFKCKAKK
jgi:SNF2 family DNA or RNA helicase